MGEFDAIEQRVTRVESDVKNLYDRINSFAVSQASTNTKLDSLLVTLGELKAIVNRLNDRPAAMWERLVSGILGALAAGIAATVLRVM
ncbi:MAG: hypothetical protein WCN92_12895 [Eubacteriales bacterium]